jgi:hypothetical protein
MTITREIYANWAQTYAPRVGLNHAKGAEMLASWFDELADLGVTTEELALAGDLAAKRLTDRPSRSLGDHRTQLFNAVTSVRSVRVVRQERSEWDKQRSTAMDGDSVRALLLSKGLLTDRHRRLIGAPTIKEQRLQERVEVPEDQRGDAWEPPGVIAK